MKQNIKKKPSFHINACWGKINNNSNQWCLWVMAAPRHSCVLSWSFVFGCLSNSLCLLLSFYSHICPSVLFSPSVHWVWQHCYLSIMFDWSSHLHRVLHKKKKKIVVKIVVTEGTDQLRWNRGQVQLNTFTTRMCFSCMLKNRTLLLARQ